MSKVDDLIAAGFQQVSRKHRNLARLPPGKTGLEALSEVDSTLARRFLDNANELAAMMFMRVHARGDDHVELSREEFVEFLEKTGRRPLREGER